MSFSLEERIALLGLKGIGPTVITRLEQMGIESLADLSKASVSDILTQASAATGSTGAGVAGVWLPSAKAQTAKASKKEINLDPSQIYFIPLGGSEQFGVNFIDPADQSIKSSLGQREKFL